MILRLATRLDKDRFVPLIVTQSESELTRRAREEGIDTRIIPYKGILDSYGGSLVSSSPLQNLKTSLRLLQYNVEAWSVLRSADVIWCDYLRTLITLLPDALLQRTPLIWNVGYDKPSEGVARYLNEVGFRTSNCVFIESETQARRIFGNQFKKHRNKFVIFNKGIDTAKFSPKKENRTETNSPIHIGTAGSLTRRKGHDVLLNAFSRLRENDIDAKLSIAGGISRENEEYKRSLDNQIKALGLDDHVTFEGWIEADDMPDYYRGLDIFVLASRNEGIPGVVREAMACGIPTVATDVGGTSSAVHDQETGLLVGPESPHELANALEELADNAALRQKLGSAGREHIYNHFSVDSYVSNYEILLQVLA